MCEFLSNSDVVSPRAPLALPPVSRVYYRRTRKTRPPGLTCLGVLQASGDAGGLGDALAGEQGHLAGARAAQAEEAGLHLWLLFL